METQYTGKLDISRLSPTRGDPQPVISITLHDDASGVVVLEIQFTPEMLGMALTGRTHIPCTFQLYGVSAVGKQRETKTEDIEQDSTIAQQEESDNPKK